MRKFAANIAFTGTKYIHNPLIITTDEGEILSVAEKTFNSQEMASLEYHSGMIIPGLINAHTHTELTIPNQCYREKKGIIDFVQHVIRLRRAGIATNETSIRKTLRQMQFQGTRAFADIANSSSSFPAKMRNKQIDSKTFFEFFPLDRDQANQQLDNFNQCRLAFPELDIFPAFHSPYAISLTGLSVVQNSFDNTTMSSLHFRENEFETALHAEDNPLNRFYQKMNPDFRPAFVNPEFSSGQGEILQNVNHLLLVHNIYSTEQEILNLKKWAENHAVNLSFVLCPRSNDNITGVMPPLYLLMKHKLNICLGTDSLLSAPNLSIFDEMKFLQHKFPNLRLQDLLRMVSFNAANALGWSDKLGEIAVGKRPGLNLIEMKHLKQDTLYPDAKLNVLI